jgi:hypothetical protein
MTERYAKLGKNHIAKTGDTARALWNFVKGEDRTRAVRV